MSKSMVKIHNIETDEVIVREMTDDEYEAHLADVATEEVRKAELELVLNAKKAAKLAAEAKLEALGLTIDDLAALGL